MLAKDNRKFLKLLGEEAGCRQLARAFYGRVAANDELKPLFPGKSLRCATEEFGAFLIQFLDGDPDQTQYRWWLSLCESHARFEISERQRQAWLRLMDETINSLIQDEETRQALRQFFQAAAAYIVSDAVVELNHRELNQRWLQQQALDMLMDDIARGRDAEAIAGAPQFVTRPAVFVGVLARMMEAGRESLIDYVVESIRSHGDLVNVRFNGRTLLHFAAGASCLPVVRQLLALGVSPDVLDGGGHTPLYRVAGLHGGEQGAEIVRELVRAGAAVDHCGGVSRSTPLHQAARFGDVRVAQALVDMGASRTAKDKKGHTPLDRALSCRRHNVAALLASG